MLSGCFSTNRIFTIDLMPLKPYFHGTTSRSGAPFCVEQRLAVQARGEHRQRMHRFVHPQRLHVRPVEHAAWRMPGISCGRSTVVNSTNFAFDDGSKRLSRFASGKPSHGITIDQPSTQRMR